MSVIDKQILKTYIYIYDLLAFVYVCYRCKYRPMFFFKNQIISKYNINMDCDEYKQRNR